MVKTDIKKLFVAIERHDHELVLGILKEEKGALEVVGHHNAYCRDKTPLMYAMQCEDLELAKQLIDLGADVKARMLAGHESSIIQLAVKFGHGLNPNFNSWLQFVEILVKAGANPSDALWPACHSYSKTSDRPEIISLLLASGASPETEVGNSGSTAKDLIKMNSQLYSNHVLGLFGL